MYGRWSGVLALLSALGDPVGMQDEQSFEHDYVDYGDDDREDVGACDNALFP